MDKMKQPRNMAALRAYLAGDMKNFAVAQVPGGIEAQEAAGQTMLVESQILPQEGTIKPGFYGDPKQTQQQRLEAVGFVFGEQVDDLFVRCQLPPGWTKQAEDHSMWSRLEDEHGRKRASIFYKAAFYDRSAHLSLEQRFTYRTWYAPTIDQTEDFNQRREAPVCMVVLDGRTPIFATASFQGDNLEAKGEARKACELWLETHYADWRDPFKYWELEAVKPIER